MAKTDAKPTEDSAATPNATPVSAPDAVPTPDNTPLPGGGRWRWDDSVHGWVDQDASEPDPLL